MQQKTIPKLQVELSWPGKADAIALADMPAASYLEPHPALSLHFRTTANRLIEGDNLEALKCLSEEMAGGIKAIYIDPPYNTGNDFVYRDRRNHAAWLSMMMPRLILARRLLSADGAIFVSIDDHEVDKLRTILSEIFGEENFVAQITVQSNPRGRQSDRHFAIVHEYLLVYARSHEQCVLKGTELTAEQLREFSGIDESGRRYRLLGLRQRGAASLREDRPAMYYPIYVDPATAKVSLARTSDKQIEVYPRKSTGQAGRWMWGRERAEQMCARLEAKLIARRNEWDVFVRDYVDAEDGTARRRKLKTIWDDSVCNYQNGKRELKALLGEAPVDYPKPVGLLKKIIATIDDPSATFMDFFAGSGTLAQAVMESNTEDGGTRNFILIQLAEQTDNRRFPTIADICRERVLAAAKTLAPQGDASFGFRYFRLMPNS